ncbi:hypothetical protein Lgra_0163 [Legionella gratiana]|uniref:Uncharacterized protein n=1 Tax=Legionella gratiana TaxID=45066 RepID=A0A378JKC9_9GAMM|nr:hypothetical protein [Legionella gratiana]KTD15497.1 hypothetical protein Lgra_0163 [Legionella gratiana]STX45160.1 Uncharacterised protein [Legionella gratiana]
MYHLNKYSNTLIITYIAAFVVMQIGSQSSIIEGLVSLPIILFVVFWSERITDALKDSRLLLEQTSFKRDMFLISYSCLIAFITALIFQVNNVDAKGWWPLIIILSGVYAIIGGLLFSLLALLLDKNHSFYTSIFATTFFLGYVVLSLLPTYFNLTYFSQNQLFIYFIIILFTVHLLICLGYQLRKRLNS